MPDYSRDTRVVMTLDAGGTSFVFSAIAGNRPVAPGLVLSSHADDLERSLSTLVEGFRRVQSQLTAPPAAISFAFPGPADYASGIIVRPPNLPAWRDVPLGPMLEEKFGLPTFINNDGDLFTCGEAASGFLPYVNGLLERAGSPKRFRNLLGVTLGTGFGAGIVRDGELFTGDNSASGEIWLMRHKREPHRNVEEGASIRAIQRKFAELTGKRLEETPDPRAIAEVADAAAPYSAAARAAFQHLGETAGDAIAQAITLLDGLVVIGGGIAGAYRHFLPALIDEMNACFEAPGGARFPRMVSRAFNLEDAGALEEFLQGRTKELAVPWSSRKVRFDALPRIGVGISRLGTSEATAIGAYAFALNRLGAVPA
jgi:glucokinase